MDRTPGVPSCPRPWTQAIFNAWSVDNARMSYTVFLGNLPSWVTADDIKSWLTAENLVADQIKVIRNPETQESKGFAFIEAPNQDEMQSIIRRFDRAPLEDRLLRANPAQPPKTKRPTAPSGAANAVPSGHDRGPRRTVARRPDGPPATNPATGPATGQTSASGSRSVKRSNRWADCTKPAPARTFESQRWARWSAERFRSGTRQGPLVSFPFLSLTPSGIVSFHLCSGDILQGGTCPLFS